MLTFTDRVRSRQLGEGDKKRSEKNDTRVFSATSLLKSLPVTMPRPYLIVPYSRSRFKHFSDVNHSSLLRCTGMSMKSWYHKKQMKRVMVTILCLYMACCISAIFRKYLFIVISIEKLSSDPITTRIIHDSMSYICPIAWSFLCVLPRCSRGQTRRFRRYIELDVWTVFPGNLLNVFPRVCICHKQKARALVIIGSKSAAAAPAAAAPAAVSASAASFASKAAARPWTRRRQRC